MSNPSVERSGGEVLCFDRVEIDALRSVGALDEDE